MSNNLNTRRCRTWYAAIGLVNTIWCFHSSLKSAPHTWGRGFWIFLTIFSLAFFIDKVREIVRDDREAQR